MGGITFRVIYIYWEGDFLFSQKAYLTSGQVHPIWQTGLRRMVTKNKLHVPHATCSSAPLPLQQLMGRAQPMCDTSLAAQMESKSLESEDSMELWKTWLQDHSFSISMCFWRTSLILAPANLGYAMILWTLFAASAIRNNILSDNQASKLRWGALLWRRWVFFSYCRRDVQCYSDKEQFFSLRQQKEET